MRRFTVTQRVGHLLFMNHSRVCLRFHSSSTKLRSESSSDRRTSRLFGARQNIDESGSCVCLSRSHHHFTKPSAAPRLLRSRQQGPRTCCRSAFKVWTAQEPFRQHGGERGGARVDLLFDAQRSERSTLLIAKRLGESRSRRMAPCDRRIKTL